MFNDSTLNFQNFPKNEIRSMIIAPDNHYIVTFDYAALEARVIGMASHDESLCSDIINGIDIHYKWTDKIINKYGDILNFINRKDLRTYTKSSLVFGGVYGSSKESIIRRYNKFKVPRKIMEDIFDEYWETYTGVKKWQNKLLSFYDKYGYTTSLTGRRRGGALSVNKILNFCIQSTASYDICLCAGDRLSIMAYELKKPQYQYRMNIHDELVFYIPEESLEDDIKFIANEMVNSVYDWVIVPLEVECSVGKNWYELEEITTFKGDYNGK